MARIKEIIVVEGKDDITAVKAAVDAELISVGGFGVQAPEVLREIFNAQQKNGVIVFTDPDHAGERIRAIITRHIPDVKHAFLPKHEGTRQDGKIGVEYASPEAIRQALSLAKHKLFEWEEVFVLEDLRHFGLSGHPQASARRQKLGELLGIGNTNTKQFLRRLNHFGISFEDFVEAAHQLPPL